MNRHALWSAACVAAFFVCVPASAQINKCVDARGRVSYQEQPCPGAKIERVYPAEPSQPAAAPDPRSKESDARARVDAPPPSADLRSQCPHAFAAIEKARAKVANLAPGEQERMREALRQEEAIWRKRCD